MAWNDFAAAHDARGPVSLANWLAAIRVHHWVKNLLVFVPLMLGHRWTELDVLGSTAIAFLLLLAVTSSTYLFNDVVDIGSDRGHRTKRDRPIASGALPISHALGVAGFTLPVALAIGFAVDLVVGLLLLSYATGSIAYSLVLKRIPLLDVMAVAVLITLRLAIGSSLIDSAPPVWLLTFSIFLFFSLAMAKRHTEILQAARAAGSESLASRGYNPGDWPLTLAFGVSSGFASLGILVFYLVDEAFRVVGYARPELLWGVIAAVAVWIGRIWLLTHRGEMNDDPVSFALRDRPSRLIAAAAILLFFAAL